MRSLPPVLAAATLLAGSVALIARERSSDPYSARNVRALLEAPLTTRKESENPAQPFWRALLAHPRVRHSDRGLELPLGRVQADPTIARASALAAGELLGLPALAPDGREGPPLFAVILASSAAREEHGQRIVKLFGCRHSATPAGAPALEDSYHARLAVAAGLEQAAAAAGTPIVLEGVETPVVGGVNFELAWLDGRQTLDVTFAGEPKQKWSVTRPFTADAPADREARARLVGELLRLASGDASLGTLTVLGLDEPDAEGIDLRLELLGGRLSAATSPAQGARLAAWVPLTRAAARDAGDQSSSAVPPDASGANSAGVPE